MRVAQADRALRDDARLAARLYLAVWTQVPTRVDLLYKAALAEMDADDLAAAKGHLQQYLATTPADAADRPQAQALLESIGRRLDAGLATGTPGKVEAPAPQRVAPPPPSEAPKITPMQEVEPAIVSPAIAQAPSHTGAWTLTGAGGALALGGLALYLATLGDARQFDADTKPDAKGEIVLLSRTEAQEQMTAINLRMGTAAALAGAGVLTAGVGAWLLLQAPARHVALAPGPGVVGASLAWRF